MTEVLRRRAAPGRTTRQAVLDAGLALFEEQGFEATTMEQVAAAAGVSVITVFRTVGTKENIVFSTREQEVSRLAAAVEGAFPYGDPRRRVREGLIAYAGRAPAAVDEYDRRLAVIAASPVLQRTSFDYRRQLEQALVASLPDPAASNTAAAAAGGAAVLHLTMVAWHAAGGGPADLPAAMTRTVDALWPDLAGDPQPGEDGARVPSRNADSSSGGMGRANR